MTMGIWTLIGLLAAVAALRFAMDATKVDTEHLCAALSAYLLAGTCFGLLYWVLEQIKSGTFVYPGEFSQTRDRKSTRLNSSHGYISYADFSLKKYRMRVDVATPRGVRGEPVCAAGVRCCNRLDGSVRQWPQRTDAILPAEILITPSRLQVCVR